MINQLIILNINILWHSIDKKTTTMTTITIIRIYLISHLFY